MLRICKLHNPRKQHRLYLRYTWKLKQLFLIIKLNLDDHHYDLQYFLGELFVVARAIFQLYLATVTIAGGPGLQI
jgi:hypothetical protein